MNRELYLSPEEIRKFKIKKYISQTIVYLFLVVMALFIIIPFYWMIISSLKTTAEVTSSKVRFLPIDLATNKALWPWDWQWNNYTELIKGRVVDGVQVLRPMPFAWMFANTIIVGALTTIGTTITVVLAAFAFSRLNFKGREVLFSILLATMMIPGEVFVITNYMTISNFGWIRTASHTKTIAALVFPFITSVFYIFFLRQTFRQIPNELYLAAKVDGTSDFKYLLRVMIPMAQATIFTIIILSMIGTWNAYVWPNFVTNPSYKNFFLVSNGLLDGFQNAVESKGPKSILNLQMAGSTLVTVPLLITFFIFKKYIMRGVSRSGIKG